MDGYLVGTPWYAVEERKAEETEAPTCGTTRGAHAESSQCTEGRCPGVWAVHCVCGRGADPAGEREAEVGEDVPEHLDELRAAWA